MAGDCVRAQARGKVGREAAVILDGHVVRCGGAPEAGEGGGDQSHRPGRQRRVTDQRVVAAGGGQRPGQQKNGTFGVRRPRLAQLPDPLGDITERT